MVAGGGCKIGVLGGIGPEATGYFYNKLISSLQERGLIRSNRDFPQIVVNSIHAPELIYDRISEHDLEPYVEGLMELEIMGVDFISMVCNTIHLHLEKIQKQIDTHIIDLREDVKEHLLGKGIKSVLVLGTPSTIRQGLYRFPGILTFEPTRREMKQLTKAIFRFNKGEHNNEQVRRLKELCQKYLSKGAEKVILACTEFAVMLEGEGIPSINTIDVLVESTINRFLACRNMNDKAISCANNPEPMA